jgi:hypothetical protein
VSTKLKHKDNEFKLTPKVLLRLSLFALIFYFLVNYLSQNYQNITPPQFIDSAVLGDLDTKNPTRQNLFNDFYQKLPDSSRQYIEDLGKSPVIISLQENISNIKKSTDGFPQKQIKEIKKNLVKSISDEIIKSIDEE